MPYPNFFAVEDIDWKPDKRKADHAEMCALKVKAGDRLPTDETNYQSYVFVNRLPKDVKDKIEDRGAIDYVPRDIPIIKTKPVFKYPGKKK